MQHAFLTWKNTNQVKISLTAFQTSVHITRSRPISYFLVIDIFRVSLKLQISFIRRIISPFRRRFWSCPIKLYRFFKRIYAVAYYIIMYIDVWKLANRRVYITKKINVYDTRRFYSHFK